MTAPGITPDVRLLGEVAAGHVTVLPLAGCVVLAPGGRPRRRRVVTRVVAELLLVDLVEIGPGVGRRIPVLLSARGRELLTAVDRRVCLDLETNNRTEMTR